jgi:hypothetical protein
MTQRNPFNPALADGIRRFGFRKWYERELLSSHAHMALALLASVALIASFEAFKGGSWGEKLVDTAFVLVCATIALWALRRYLYLLMHAEEMANQANCGKCQAYGLLQVPDDSRVQAHRLVPVCCKRCGFRWDMEDG